MDFCLISVPFGHYDEPEILRYENTSACPIGADVRQFRLLADEYLALDRSGLVAAQAAGAIVEVKCDD